MIRSKPSSGAGKESSTKEKEANRSSKKFALSEDYVLESSEDEEGATTPATTAPTTAELPTLDDVAEGESTQQQKRSKAAKMVIDDGDEESE